jgi:hypothetical protein
MPIFLDTARTDWSWRPTPRTDWATPAVPDAELYPARPGGQRLHRGCRFRRRAGLGHLGCRGRIPSRTTDDGGDVAADAEQGWTSAGEPLPPDLGDLLDGPGRGAPRRHRDAPPGSHGPRPTARAASARRGRRTPPELDAPPRGPARTLALPVDGAVTGCRRPTTGSSSARRPVRDRVRTPTTARRPDRAGPTRRALGCRYSTRTADGAARRLTPFGVLPGPGAGCEDRAAGVSALVRPPTRPCRVDAAACATAAVVRGYLPGTMPRPPTQPG